MKGSFTSLGKEEIWFFSTFEREEDGMDMDVIEIEDDNAIEDSSNQNPPPAKKHHLIPPMFSKSGKTVLRI